MTTSTELRPARAAVLDRSREAVVGVVGQGIANVEVVLDGGGTRRKTHHDEPMVRVP